MDLINVYVSFAYFVGSSTDLTPSVIGYYDNLSSNLNEDDIKIASSRKAQSDKISVDNIQRLAETRSKLTVSKIPSQIPKSNLTVKKQSTFYLSPPPQKHQYHHKTVQVSSSVQRMISSHQTTAETTTVAPPSVKSFIHDLNIRNNARKLEKERKSSNLRIFRNPQNPNQTSSSTFHIPLTKNLSKISQANSYLDSSEPIVHTVTDHNDNGDDFNGSESIDSDKTPTNSDSNNSFIYDNLLRNNGSSGVDEDDDNIQNVLDKTSELINNLINNSNANNALVRFFINLVMIKEFT